MTSIGELSHRGQLARLRRLAEQALASYDVRPDRVTPLRRSDNAAFRVDAADSKRFVLRIHRVSGTPWHPVRGIAEVASELTWLAAIRRDTDVIVPEPVPNQNGALLTVAEIPGVPEPRVCVLSRWVEGRFFDAGLSATQLGRVGSFMARLHEHAAGFARPEGFVRGRVGDISPAVVTYVLETLGAERGPDAVEIARAVIDRARAVQQALGEDPQVFGLIHGDLHQENYLFHRGQARAIDFDDCGFGHLHWDFAVTLSEVSYKPGYDALKTALLRGYETVRPLPEDLEPSLAPLMALRLLQLAMWLLEMRADPSFSDWEVELDEILTELKETAA